MTFLYRTHVVGTPKITDTNGDGEIDPSDQIAYGTSLPQAHGGWINELKWKNFDLNLLFNITLRRQIVNNNAVSLADGYPIFLDLRDVTFWQKEGDQADYGRIGTYPPYQEILRSDVENVNSVSLKQITLGYSVPKSVLDRIRVFKDIRCFVTGENIFYLSNYSGANPEVVNVYSGIDTGGAYPLPQKWTIGLTLKF